MTKLHVFLIFFAPFKTNAYHAYVKKNFQYCGHSGGKTINIKMNEDLSWTMQWFVTF
jgi:hypothetical protein